MKFGREGERSSYFRLLSFSSSVVASFVLLLTLFHFLLLENTHNPARAKKQNNETKSPILPPRQGRLPGDVQARRGRRPRGDGQRARPGHLPRAVVALGPAQADGPGAGEDSGLGRGRVREKEVLRRARHRQREGEWCLVFFYSGVGKQGGASWSKVPSPFRALDFYPRA